MSSGPSEENKVEITKDELEKIVKKNVRKELEKEKKSQKGFKQDKNNQISRRGFLKKLGLGAAGLGAMSLAPAAADINIKHDGDFKLDSTDMAMDDSNIMHNGNKAIEFNSNKLAMPNKNLDMGTNKIRNLRKKGNKPVVSEKVVAIEENGDGGPGKINFDRENNKITLHGEKIADIGGSGGAGTKIFKTPGKHTLDVSSVDEIDVEILGAGAGDGADGNIGDGKQGDPGDFIKGKVNVSNLSKLEIYVGSEGKNASNKNSGSGGNKGLTSGGNGADGKFKEWGTCSSGESGGGGGGGGSSGIQTTSGTEIIEAAGGSGGSGGDGQYGYGNSCYPRDISGGSGGSGGGKTEAKDSRVLSVSNKGSGGEYGSGQVNIDLKSKASEGASIGDEVEKTSGSERIKMPDKKVLLDFQLKSEEGEDGTDGLGGAGKYIEGTVEVPKDTSWIEANFPTGETKDQAGSGGKAARIKDDEGNILIEAGGGGGGAEDNSYTYGDDECYRRGTWGGAGGGKSGGKGGYYHCNTGDPPYTYNNGEPGGHHSDFDTSITNQDAGGYNTPKVYFKVKQP